MAQDNEKPLTTDSIIKIALSVFPEAYPEFAEVLYESLGNGSYLKTVSFVMPAKIANKKYTDEILKKKATELKALYKIEGCEGINKGEPQQYAWYAWTDKNVVRITYYFGIGC